MLYKSTRREFIKRSSGFATGIIVLPHIIPSTAIGMGGKLPPSDRIIFGTIGTGSQGMSNLKDFCKLNNEVQFVALCDVDMNRLQKAKTLVDETNDNKDCRMYIDYREFLEKENLDAVNIAIPDHWHGIIYSACAARKLHIYGEKPICRTIKDGQVIVSTVKKNNIIWQTGSWQRSQGHFRHACELVRNGRIGKIKFIEAGLPDGIRSIGTPPVQEVPPGLNWDMWLGPALKVPYRGIVHFDWRWILDYSGGQLTDWAGHYIDIANWGADLENTGPTEISGTGVYPVEGIFDVPYEFDILCKYENAIEMRVANASRLIHGTGATWYGDLGWIHVDRYNVLTASDPKLLEGEIGEDEIHLYKSDNHFQNFINCIRSQKETVAPIEGAYRAISIGLLGEIAMTTGQIIKWDPVKEEIIGNQRANRLLSRPYREPWTLFTV